MRGAAGFFLIAMLGGPALAQEDGWSFAFSPYIWTPGVSSSVETRFGTLDADASIDDVLSATDFAFMGAFEARYGPWSLIADLIYTDLTERSDTPFGVLFSEAQLETELAMATFYGGYRIHEDDRVAMDVLGGARAVWLDIDVTLDSGALPSRSFGLSESWVDPVVGARARFALTDRWFATALADVGGFGAGSDLVLAGARDRRLPDQRSLVGTGRLAADRDREGDRGARHRSRPRRTGARRHGPLLIHGRA